MRLRDITPIMENQMGKLKIKMDTLGPLKGGDKYTCIYTHTVQGSVPVGFLVCTCSL